MVSSMHFKPLLLRRDLIEGANVTWKMYLRISPVACHIDRYFYVGDRSNPFQEANTVVIRILVCRQESGVIHSVSRKLFLGSRPISRSSLLGYNDVVVPMGLEIVAVDTPTATTLIETTSRLI
jgi:hypothetical protein